MINQMMLWFNSAKTRILTRMAYRGEYFISILSMFLLEMVGPLLAFVIYYNTDGFVGWNFYQVMLLQGLFLLVKGFSYATFFGITWNAVMCLRRGIFDLILIKPRNLLFMFVCDSFDAEDIGKFLTGVVITTYALVHLPEITLINIIYGFISLLLSLSLFFGIALFAASFSFIFIGTFRIYEILESFFMIGNYPKSIYPKSIGTFFTAIIPIFLIAVFPANIFFGNFTKDIFISSISAFVFIMLGLLTWNYSIKKYSSAGG